MATKRSTVIGVFGTREQAQGAVDELHRAGFSPGQITVVMHQEHHKDVNLTDPDAAKAAYITGDNQAGKGAAIGAVAGAVGGGALALAVGLIPGVGPVLSAGTMAAVCFGIEAGAAGGGIVGALIGQDFPEEEARYYERELKAGRVLVGVHDPDRLDEARAILDRVGGYHALAPQAATAGVRHAPATQPMPVAEKVLPPQV